MAMRESNWSDVHGCLGDIDTDRRYVSQPKHGHLNKRKNIAVYV